MKKLINILFIIAMIFSSCSKDEENAIDYTQLDKAVTDARSVADVNREGNQGGDLIIGSTEILNAQIEKYAAYRTTAKNQGTVDNAVKYLNAATEKYLASVVVIDPSGLVTTIASAQSTHDAAVEGTIPGQYAVGSKAILQEAIDDAQIVADNANASQDEINSANTALNIAIANFESGKVPPLNLTEINAAISNAQALHDGAVEGTEIGQYAVGSKAILQDAIDAAKAVVDNQDATQALIDSAKITLDTAVATFEAGQVFGPDRDITVLTATIATAQSLHDSAAEGTSVGDYAFGSKATLQAAIDAAQTVADDLSTNQLQVDAANTTLEDAIATFQATQNVIYALSFDGDDYIETAGFQGISGGARRTMEAWIKTTSSANTTGMIMSWGENASQMKWDMKLHNSGTLRIEYSGGGLNGSTIINDDEWHHVAVVVPTDGAVLTSALLYVDGALETLSNASGGAPINTSNVLNYRIGRGASQADRYFVGLMSDVRIWDVARSASEIAAAYNTRLTGNEPGLVGYWKLNDANGTDAGDSSSSGYTGTLGGADGSSAVPTWVGVTSGLPFDN